MNKNVKNAFFCLFYALVFTFSFFTQANDPIHIVSDKRVSVLFCKQQVYSGEDLFNKLRKLGYLNEDFADLVPLILNKNKNSGRLEALNKKTDLLIPVAVFKEKYNSHEKQPSCENLIERDKESHLLISGAANKVLFDRGEYYFYNYLALSHPLEDSTNLKVDTRNIANVENEGLQTARKPSIFSFGLAGVFDTLEGSKNSDTLFVSELQPHLQGTWRQPWSHSLYSFFQAEWTLKKYENFRQDTYSAEGLSQNQSRLSLGIEKHLHSTQIKIQTGMVEALLYREKTGNVLAIEKDPALYLQAGVSQRLLEQNKHQLLLKLDAGYTGAGSLGFKGGYDYSAGMELRQLWPESTVSGELIYGEGFYQTDDLEFKQRRLQFLLRYDWGQL